MYRELIFTAVISSFALYSIFVNIERAKGRVIWCVILGALLAVLPGMTKIIAPALIFLIIFFYKKLEHINRMSRF